MQAGDLAAHLSRVTRAEPKLCYRSPSEIRRAIADDRFFVSREGSDPAGVLFLWPYGEDWVELGTAYVFPEHRGRGHLTRVHEAATRHLESDGRSAFEFPGNGAVQHVLEKTGFVRTSIRELPWSVWSEFLRERRTSEKIRGYLDMVRTNDPWHSLKLYTYDPNGREPSPPGPLETAVLP